MLSVPGVYEDGVVTLLEPIPNIRTANVIITVLETHHPMPETLPRAPASGDWLGAMRGTCLLYTSRCV